MELEIEAGLILNKGNFLQILSLGATLRSQANGPEDTDKFKDSNRWMPIKVPRGKLGHQISPTIAQDLADIYTIFVEEIERDEKHAEEAAGVKQGKSCNRSR